MHTLLTSARTRRLTSIVVSLAMVGMPIAPLNVQAGTGASTAPQVLLAVTNSESMDGTTSGAIMVGSGANLGASRSTLTNSSSPVNYTVPTGFTPPLGTNGDGTAKYTVLGADGRLRDNGPSRLNMAKQAIRNVLANYGSSINFGLYGYKVSNVNKYTTWVYHMSDGAGANFGMTNTAAANTVANPCYNFNASSSDVKTSCQKVANVAGMGNISSYRYLTIGDSSDDADINDVLYTNGGLDSVILTYGNRNPNTPFPPNRTLAQFNASQVSITYDFSTGGLRTTSPTNAGYVPFSGQVLYAQRGFGYGASQDAATGQLLVSVPSGTIADFNTILQPETDDSGTGEMKAAAGQSAIGGLMSGARTYLSGVPKDTCQKQYVVLLTDGLPTLDLNGKPWPPVGTVAGNNYGVTATFNQDGSLNSTNSQAIRDAIDKITALRTAGIKVYVIGLGAGVDATKNAVAAQTLTAMAVAGGTTNFFPATDATALDQAFQTVVQQIYTASSIAAPIAPLSVAGGGAYQYSMTTTPNPIAGSVKAYAVTAAGVPTTTPVWDAAALMTSADRRTKLYTTSTSGTAVLLKDVDAAAFALSGSPTCVPDVATIVNYTVDPSYTSGSCTYLSGRQSGWFLGGFSKDNTGRYIGPPSNSTLLADASYVTYARARASRTPMVMFTNNDGFLYAIDATTGQLRWAWMPRGIVAQLKNYSSFQAGQYMNGNFTVVDAKDAGGAWASYVVGSAQGGAERYSLKLDNSGMPSAVVYDTLTSNAQSPGDQSQTTGQAPLHQTPVVIQNSTGAFAVYVQNTVVSGTTVSTLNEVNVATGVRTSATLPFTLSSQIEYVKVLNQLWMGGADGTVRTLGFTGNAATDAGTASVRSMFSTINPSTNSGYVTPVTYVGYTEVEGVPYAYALNPSQITVYTVRSTGWGPVWASTPSSGYTYNTATSLFASSASVTTMTSNTVISDAPLILGAALILPLYQPPADSCGTGSGWYDFFDLSNGQFPSVPITYSNSAVTADFRVGDGPAFTPSASITKTGIVLSPGTAGTLAPVTPLLSNSLMGNSPVSWRRL